MRDSAGTGSGLDAAQIEAFHSVGYVTVDGVFTPAEVDDLRAAFDRLEKMASTMRVTQMHRGSRFVLGPPRGPGHAGPAVIRRIVWCGAAEPVLSRYGKDPRLTRMAAALLDSPTMSQLINQAHYKSPGDGVHFPWHQDSTHRRHGGDEWKDVNGRGSYVQTLTAIDDVTPDNGPLQLIPFTGKLGHLALAPGGPLPDSVRPETARPALMKAGSVLLFGPYTIHMSEPNESSHPRRAFLNGFAAPGANRRVYPGTGAGRCLRAGD
ncbi:MAG: phytanoyl-CoA dioxygenase family protein [Acidobacteriota bacterium]